MTDLAHLPIALSCQQVADALQIDRQTVYEMIRRKQIPAHKFGREYRIPRMWLVRLLEEL